MGEKKLIYYSIEEYLQIEEKANLRHEYHNGRVYAMAGGSIADGFLGTNINFSLKQALKGTNCSVFNGDVKIHIESTNSFVYPDSSVVCGEIQRSDKFEEALSNPTLIVEVLSKSTAKYDMSEKFHKYRTLPSLKEYLLIDQDKPILTLYRKTETDFWKIDIIEGLENKIELESLNITLSLQEIYDGIEDIAPFSSV